MFLFMTFDTYMVKVLGGHKKGKCRKVKHHTIFKIKQQPSGNICGSFVCISIVAFGLQPNCVISVSASILLYESASRLVVNFDVSNDNLIKCLILLLRISKDLTTMNHASEKSN
jgi:hypothetical protein